MDVNKSVNSFEMAMPELLAQWHPTKNLELKPSDVVAGTHKKIWWLCPLGHEWQASGAKRLMGQGCPACAGRLVVRGSNDLLTLNPDLAAQWDDVRNGELKSTDLTAGSGKKVWWLCSMNHSFSAPPSQRKAGQGCPFCSSNRVLSGFNDLLTTHPEIAKQWHPSKNGDLTPDSVIAGSNKKYWWKCDQEHEWIAPGANRVKGSGCPFCSGLLVVPGVNDFETLYPTLSKEWDIKANLGALPRNASPGSGRKVWWLCSLQHAWQAGVHQRIQGAGCPICSGRVAFSGFNDLLTTHPEIAKQWHPSKNGDLTPDSIIAGSNKKYWWKCDQEHEWMATGNHRVNGRGCPNCAKSGFDQTSPSTFYFIENHALRARKVGIANKSSQRLAQWQAKGWEVLATHDSETGNDIRELETRILRWIRNDLGMPPFLGYEEIGRGGGWSETFSSFGVSNSRVLDMIKIHLADIRGAQVDPQQKK